MKLLKFVAPNGPTKVHQHDVSVLQISENGTFPFPFFFFSRMGTLINGENIYNGIHEKSDEKKDSRYC